MLTAKTSFLIGFNYGRTPEARELSAREIAANWPDVEVDAFVGGHLDGLAGDRFRTDLILK